MPASQAQGAQRGCSQTEIDVPIGLGVAHRSGLLFRGIMSNGIVGGVRRHRSLSAAFVLACGLALFFGIRFVRDVRDWPNADEETIQPWMTVHYVARTRDINPAAVDQIVGLDAKDDEARTLQQLASQQGVTVQALIGRLEAAIGRRKAAAARGGQP